MAKATLLYGSPETREYAEDFKRALNEVEPERADVLVPNCVYRCGCPEPNGCKWFDKVASHHLNLTSTDIQQRYDTYIEVFYGND